MGNKPIRKNGVCFVFLSILTLGIYAIVLLGKVRHRVNELDKEGKKTKPFIGIFFLSLILLGIPSSIWAAKVAGKVKKVSAIYGKEACIGPKSMFFWLFPGIFIIVGPFIAWGRFFKGLRTLEDRIASIPLLANDVVIEIPQEENVTPIEGVETPVSLDAPYQYDQNAEKNAIREKDGIRKPMKVVRKGRITGWCVRLGENGKVVKTFQSKAEALSYAKIVALSKGSPIVLRKIKR